MVAWRILIHSLKMIFNNLGQVLRIGLVPVLIGLAIVIVFAMLGVSLGGLNGDGAAGLRVGGVILLVAAVFCLALWVIVAWHRFILLAEYTQGWIPVLRFDRMLSYFGHAMLLGVVGFLAVLPLGLIMGVIGSAIPVVATIFAVLVFVIVNTVLFRLSPILPAAAIGRPLKFKEVWAHTIGSSDTILILVLILWAFQFVLQFLLGLLMLVPLVGIVLMVLGTMLSGLVNVSIMTTLYGHYVEKRAL